MPHAVDTAQDADGQDEAHAERVLTAAPGERSPTARAGLLVAGR